MPDVGKYLVARVVRFLFHDKNEINKETYTTFFKQFQY